MSEDEIEQAIQVAIIKLKENHGRFDIAVILEPNPKEIAEKLRSRMVTMGLINTEFIPTKQHTKAILTPQGWGFTTFNELRDKQELDHKLKLISYDSVRVNKWLPFYALCIAIISAVVPYVMYRISKDDVQRSSIEMPQLKQVLQNQERSLQLQKEFQDSLTKILSHAKSPDSGVQKKR